MRKKKIQQEGWREMRLGDLLEENFCVIKNHLREPLSSKERTRRQGCYPYYGAAGQIDSINNYKLEGFHLLVAEDGTVTSNGKNPMLQLVDGKFWVSNHAHILQGKTERETLLLYYMLSMIDINPYITGAVQPKLSKSNLVKISMRLPPLPEQKAIAEVLSSLDDKIDLLHRQNKTLEDMAQTLFRKWFVEDADEGWEKKRLGDIVEFKKGRKATRTENFEFEHSVPQILIETFDTGNTLYSEAEEMVIAEDRDILMVMDGASSGRTEIGFRGALGSTIGLYRPLDNFRYPFFIFCFLKTQEKYIRENTTGSAIPHADRNLVLSLKFRFSSMKKVIGFENFVGTLLTKKQSNLSQIRTLEKQRDTLLPGLMNRKVRLV